MHVLGIDIGGSGIKGAPVDVGTGELAGERYRITTPHPPTPDNVADVVAQLVRHFEWDGRVGVTFPGVVNHGVIATAANLAPAFVGVDAHALFAKATGRPATVLNDADAAGVAEMRFGAGRGRPGTVLLLTFGTGIGSALFVDGTLVPNTEFGHLEIDGHDAEKHASAAARERDDQDWSHWAHHHVHPYLNHVVALLSPELVIIGGGVSKKADRFLPELAEVHTELRPAELRNEAGIVGAALAAGTH
ncbi:polyphosphate--glucose phosphotransferase [Actinocatenispora sera]|uniref:Polyphosphate glucokinase n=1 Tax=Actinocatenispora sera TaxID=390989 RepID=A0A810L8I8_9ACTN|nr:ROK family protein [Actinocatenispora sera]BCJ30651.1 polyphosphate glucokinase [Actinocatenispora sera]